MNKIFRLTLLSLIFTSFFTLNVKSENEKEYATIGGGCFWSMEALFERVNGVISVEPGYSGGNVVNPTYKEVCSSKTNHAESIQILFDPKKISYKKILEVFWKVHEPTTLNRQGVDEGTQYRSIIFYHNKKQKEIAEKSKAEIFKSGYWGKSPIVTEIKTFTKFYRAEDYHRDYYTKNTDDSYSKAVIEPKILKLKLNLKEFFVDKK
ncbi:MAG: peptide-methionine (S)-S-oxide reductase MsrA [Cyanobacteriota bacterium]